MPRAVASGTSVAAAPVPARPRGGLDELLDRCAARLRVAFVDMDGTLLLPDGTLPPATAAVIDRLEATGVRLVPATGRALWAARAALGDVADRVDLVAGNGSDVVVGGRPVVHLAYGRAELQGLLDAARHDPDRPGLIVYDARRPYQLNLEADFFARALPGLHDDAPRFTPVDELPPGEIVKAALVARSDVEGVIRRLGAAFAGTYALSACGWHWIDVALPDAGKDRGARRVLDALGAAADDAIAFGDSMNDAPLMRMVGAGVAVANAMPELKRLCAFEIGSNAQAAVIDALAAIARRRELLGCGASR